MQDTLRMSSPDSILGVSDIKVQNPRLHADARVCRRHAGIGCVDWRCSTATAPCTHGTCALMGTMN